MNKDIEKIKEAFIEAFRKSALTCNYTRFDINRDVLKVIEEVEKSNKIIVPKAFDEWYQKIIEDQTFKNLWDSDASKRDAVYLISRVGYGYALDHDISDIGGSVIDSQLFDFVRNNKLLAIRAILDGYEIEKEKVYRFEQNAFMEQDIRAASLEEAKREAEKNWHDMFQKHGLFGNPSWMGIVDEDGEVIDGSGE